MRRVAMRPNRSNPILRRIMPRPVGPINRFGYPASLRLSTAAPLTRTNR
jgi:hypothetical protein